MTSRHGAWRGDEHGGRFRTRTEIAGMFPGLEMIDPGIELCVRWWPDGPAIKPLAAAQRCDVGAIGRKP